MTRHDASGRGDPIREKTCRRCCCCTHPVLPCRIFSEHRLRSPLASRVHGCAGGQLHSCPRQHRQSSRTAGRVVPDRRRRGERAASFAADQLHGSRHGTRVVPGQVLDRGPDPVARRAVPRQSRYGGPGGTNPRASGAVLPGITYLERLGTNAGALMRLAGPLLIFTVAMAAAQGTPATRRHLPLTTGDRTSTRSSATSACSTRIPSPSWAATHSFAGWMRSSPRSLPSPTSSG
jgi:hypothetical protein